MEMTKIKDFLGYENDRNKKHADLYVRMIQLAYGDTGSIAVLIGHHLTFEVDGDINTENEIPAADTLIFDHDIMGRLFGVNAVPVMVQLAKVPCSERDELLRQLLNEYGPKE